jgi:hypothetical protein
MFCSVYVNDILIFTDESLHQHQNHAKILLHFEKLLQIDIDKCEFEVKSIKYLSSFWKLKEHTNESQKMKTIMNWQVFKSVKEYRVS